MTRTYRKWDSMIGRCYRTSHPSYKYYGNKGVTVCKQWRNSYQSFLSDMGEVPDGLWLDRIDNTKGYEPGNCRWVTPKESASNRSRTGPVINPDSLRQRSIRNGIPYIRVIQRIRMGWPEHLALTIPIQKQGAMTHKTRQDYGL